jgi:hypothetical protein
MCSSGSTRWSGENLLPLDRIPAVKRIGTSTLEVFAVEISDEFTEADAENLCGLLEGAYAIINLLVRISELQSFDISGLASDTARLLRGDTARHVNRCAIIDDDGWADRITALLGSGIELKKFKPEDAQAAWIFVGAEEVDEGV